MTEMLTTPGATVPETAPDATRRTPARALLTCGVVAGPLYVVVALLQVLVHDGFDLSRHPLSLLSLGDWGWIQITNFVIGGLLAIGFAIGLGRVLPPGRGGTWARCWSAATAWGLSLAARSSPTQASASRRGHRMASPITSAGTACCTPLPRRWRHCR
jgi:Protein of unknown function (DUF998)